ncbi:MAG: hypothetical protein KUG72_13135 [Pseudomonadales bacterium]|nr:hypothetical protein [Pseudomonadales bacterium]
MSIGLRDLKMDLIKGNNFGRYLIYVLGEICLVVVGIMIALQFNNINLAEQDREIELQYYQTMKEQLTEDRALLEEEITEIMLRSQLYSTGKEIIKTDDRTRLDEFGQAILTLITYGDFRRTSTVYRSLIFSGEIKYIQNKEIIAYLQDIERNYEITERLEDIQAQLVLSHSAPAILELIDFESGEILSPESVFTQTFVNRFSASAGIIDEKSGHFSEAINIIDRALKEIEIEFDAK